MIEILFQYDIRLITSVILRKLRKVKQEIIEKARVPEEHLFLLY